MITSLDVFEPAALGLTLKRYRELRNVFDVQSYVFYCEIMPHLWNLFPNGYCNLSLLDIGSRTGAGAALLQQIHHPESFSRIKMQVTALDIDETFLKYSKTHHPDLEYLVQDIFDESFARRFDVVVCSHTLEHVPNPSKFLDRIRSLAKQWVIVACPFDEKDLIPGHVNSISFDFLQAERAHLIHVYRSLTWHGSMAVIAIFAGKAAS